MIGLGVFDGGIAHHSAGRHLAGADDGNAALWVGASQVFAVRRRQHIEYEKGIGGAIADLAGDINRLGCDLEVRDDGAAFLAEAGLIKRPHVKAVQRRSRAQDLVGGDDTGTADAHQKNVGGAIEAAFWFGDCPLYLEDRL